MAVETFIEGRMEGCARLSWRHWKHDYKALMNF